MRYKMIEPNINDYEYDADYVADMECYGLYLEFLDEARMCEED
jgi:hypothetical protein